MTHQEILKTERAKTYLTKSDHQEGASASACHAHYAPECWWMKKDTLYAVAAALRDGLENTQELLINHDSALGRTTRSNRTTAERLESEIAKMELAIEGLRAPDGIPEHNSQDNHPSESAV